MRKLNVVLVGTSPLSFSRYHSEPKLKNSTGSDAETPDAYDKRTWRSKLHVLDDGRVYIPPMALKQAIEGAAQYNPVKKRGTATWTRNIIAAVLITDPIVIEGLRVEDVVSETLMMTSDGKPVRFSKGSRVPRTFPKIMPGWRASAEILVFDDTILENVIRQAVGDAGIFVGIGRWRAENRGLYGRFKVESAEWAK